MDQYIEVLAERAGYEVDFSDVTEEKMIEASAESFLKKYEKMSRIMSRIAEKVK